LPVGPQLASQPTAKSEPHGQAQRSLRRFMGGL
jgi:hypothetical protein